MIKLGTAADEIEVIHATSSIDAIGRIRQKNPQIIIADVEALDLDTFMRFYNTVQQTGAQANNRRILLVIPDKSYLKNFNGDAEYIMKPLNIEQITAKIRTLLLEYPIQAPPEEVR